ncbi:unnamed protein product [Caenorhabditis angaria]|uniref:Seven TM Receptor n=1 Tax=Caenorhabditis angaria TaxID=860376 RepID=A0A9P1N0D2_9PELO|nr:unnamed protein product [Caenorhabditis angaria]
MLTPTDYYNISADISFHVFFITLFTNLVLIYMTIYKIKRIVGAYKTCIIIASFLGICFQLSDISCHPFFHSYNQSFIYFTLSTWTSKYISELLLLVYCVCYSSVISFMAVQFLYRYWIMTGSRSVKYFDGWKILYSQAYIFLIGTIYSSSIYILGPFDDESRRYLRAEVMRNYNLTVESIAGFVVVAVEDHEESTLRERGEACMSTLIILISIQYMIMIYAGTQMHLKLKTQISTISTSDRSLQKQLFKALVIQVLSPSLLCCVPIIPILVGPYIFTKISFPTGIFVSPFTIFPSLDSVILMTVVTEYRECFRKMLSKNSDSTYEISGRTTKTAISRI